MPTIRNAGALLMNVSLRSELMGYENDDELEEETRRGDIEVVDMLQLWLRGRVI